MTLADRVVWVLEHRKDKIHNESKWSLAAGLTRTHVNTMQRRLKKKPNAEQELGTLNALADAANVSRAWFAHGEGTPEGEPVVEPVERYDAMSAVRGMARAERIDEEFVTKWEAHLDEDGQPGADYLWTLLKAAWMQHKRKVAPAGDPLADLDEPFVRDARKNR